MAAAAFLPFENQWVTFVILLGAIFLFIGLSEFARQRLNWAVDTSRKLVHVLVGLTVAGAIFLFQSKLPLIVMALIFILINAVTLRSNRFQSLHATERKSYGTVYFPLAFLLLILFWWEQPIGVALAMLTLALADPIATTIGDRASNPRRYRIWTEYKSIEGSMAMFLSTFLIIYVGTEFFSWFFRAAFFLPLSILIGLAGFVAMVATLAESTSERGSDNLSVPLLVFLSYDLYLVNYTHGTLPLFLGWTLISALIFFLAGQYKALSRNGMVAGFLVGILVFGAGGIQWILPLLAFFILSSILSKLSQPLWGSEVRGVNRDILQILANGALAAALALIHFYRPSESLYALFLGAVAAATADTWATEIGAFSPRNPRHILSFQEVTRGSSGGVTLLGTLGSLAGALAIGAIGMALSGSSAYLWMVTLGGFGGSLVDSILGGSLQARFTCPRCGQTTEKRRHCQTPSEYLSGLKWCDNDMVNLASTVTGVLIVLLLLYQYS